jgi:transposase
MNEFDAQTTAARLKSESRIRRKPRTYAQRRSLLDTYKHELLQLDAASCNGSELQRWLAEKGVKVERSTVNRWLHRNRVDG